MSGPPVITLDEEINFLRSIVLPAFDSKYSNSEQRMIWMRTIAKKSRWPKDKADELIRIFGCYDEEKAEAVFEAKEEDLRRNEAKAADILLAKIQLQTAKFLANGEQSGYCKQLCSDEILHYDVFVIMTV